MRTKLALAALAALTVPLAACSAPLETIADPATHKTTSPETYTAEVVEDTRPLLIRLADTGVPVYDLDTATLEENAAIICATRDMGVSHEEILEVTIEHMTMWQPVDSEKYLHFVYTEVCLADPAPAARK